MLERLAREGECSVTELAEPHRMSLPAVSKHLKVLELAGLVRRRRLGRRHAVRLAPWPLRQAWGWMEEYRRRTGPVRIPAGETPGRQTRTRRRT